MGLINEIIKAWPMNLMNDLKTASSQLVGPHKEDAILSRTELKSYKMGMQTSRFMSLEMWMGGRLKKL